MLIMKQSLPDCTDKHTGFTLIELLLVMLISSILILGINAAFRQAHHIFSSVESRRPIYQDARIITENLREELSCLYFPPAPDGNDGGDEARPFQPISVEKDQLVFYTMCPVWKSTLASSRMAKLCYHFTKDDYTDQSILRRFEQLYSGEKPIGKQTVDILAEGLSDFSVGIVGNDNKDGSEKKSFPKAIKVSLKWQATKNVPELVFQTTILIAVEQTLGP